MALSDGVSTMRAMPQRRPRVVTTFEGHPRAQPRPDTTNFTLTTGNEPRTVQADTTTVERTAGSDPLDRDLWAAAQTIRTIRQERLSAARAYIKLEDSMRAMQNAHSGLTSDYNELLENFNSLRESYSTLRARYNSLVANSPKTTEDPRQLEALQAALEQERTLKEAAETRMRKADDEIVEIKKCNAQELKARDTTIQRLEEGMKRKEDLITQMQNQLASSRQLATGAQDTDLERLKATSSDQKQTITNLEEQNAVYLAENIAARTLIEHLEKLQAQLKSNHEDDLKQLREENKHLEEVLRETLHKQETVPEEDKLQQKCQLQIQQLETIKAALMNRFPELHDSLDNINVVLAGSLGRKTRKRRHLA